MQQDQTRKKQLSAGVKIDGYELLSQINAGGYGEVYLAVQLALNRKVAIKILHLNLAAAPDLVERFRQEALAASQLRHANLVSVHDFGLTCDSRPYIVMEYIEGKNIQQALEAGPMDPAFAARRLVEIAGALSAAHKSGIVHRDIKSTNIMLADAECAESPARLLDFGLAKLMQNDQQPGLTKTGEVLGTPRYMSPEQCRGLPLDGRSDQYSLGCVFYEMLAGKPLVDFDSALDCMNWHVVGRVPPLPAGNKMLSRLQAVLERMLAKSRDDRYESMEAVKADLQRVLNGLPVSGRGRDATLARYKKPALVFLAVVASAACLGLGAWLQFKAQNTDPLSPQVPVTETPPTSSFTAPDSTVPSYYSVGELQYQIDIINAAIQRLHANHETAAAVRMENDSKFLSKSFSPPSHTEPKLMIVGVYGVREETQAQSGFAEVTVSYTSGPIILALRSYESVRWRLHIKPGVRIERIIISGDSASTLDNPPAAVPVENRSEAGSTVMPLWLDGPFTGTAQPLAEDTYGMEFATFTGATEPVDLEVGPGSADWRAQYTLRMIEPVYARASAVILEEIGPTLKSMRSWAVAELDNGEVPITDQSLRRPRAVPLVQVNGLGPIRATERSAPDSEMTYVTASSHNGDLYGIVRNAVVRFPIKSGRSEMHRLGGNNFNPVTLDDLVLDGKRQRLMAMATTDKETRSLWEYSLRTSKWSLLQRDQQGISEMFYDSVGDRLYALKGEMRDGQPSYSTLAQMLPEGQWKTTPLSRPIESGVVQDHVFICVKDGLLAAFSPKLYDPENTRLPVPARVFIYDLKSGELRWKGPMQDQ